MNTEFEVRFFPINKEGIRKVLSDAGAYQEIPERKMKRVIFELGDTSSRKWLRIRDEGDKTTIAVKEIINPDAIDGIREIEIVSNDFAQSVQLFEEIGLKLISYQENFRETWKYQDAILTIDTWPGLEPILEIEGSSSEHVKAVIQNLPLNFCDTHFGAIDRLYELRYGINAALFKTIKYLSFDTVKKVLDEYTNDKKI